MSLEYIVHGVIVGNRESLEKISQEWNDLSSSNKIDILTESSFDKDDNLRFYGQMRNCIGVAAAIDKFLTDDVKCYRLWGTLDGCCELYTDDFGHKFFNNYFVFNYDTEEYVWFETADEATDYLLKKLEDNTDFIRDFEESGETDKKLFAIENSTDYAYRIEPDDPVLIMMFCSNLISQSAINKAVYGNIPSIQPVISARYTDMRKNFPATLSTSFIYRLSKI